MRRRTQQVSASRSQTSAVLAPKGPALSSYSANKVSSYGFDGSEGDFEDSEGLHDLTVAGGAWSYEQAGKDGVCVAAGSNSYAIQDDEGFAPEGVGAEFTLNFWMSIQTLGGRAFGWFLTHASQSNMLAMHFSGDRIYLQRNGSTVGLSSSKSIKTDRFHMITFVRGGGSLRVYVDRILAFTYSGTGWDVDLTDWELVLGKSAGNYQTTGTKYDHGVYYSAALSQTAISELYEEFFGAGATFPESTTYLKAYQDALVGAFKVNGAGDNLLNEMSGRGDFILESGTATFSVAGKNGNCVSCVNNPYWSQRMGLLNGVVRGAFSVNMWVRITSSSGTKQIMNITPNSASISNNIYIEINSSREVNLRGPGTGSLVLSDPLTLNQWHMITIVRDGELTRLFVDRKEVGSTDDLNELNVNFYEIWLGRLSSNYASNLDRDEILIFTDALSESAINELFEDEVFVTAAA